MQNGRTLAVFCHFDGAVWLFDLPTLTIINLPRPQQQNPFWLSPVVGHHHQLVFGVLVVTSILLWPRGLVGLWDRFSR